MTPKVSIITTVYDRIACLRRCIASVKKLQQPGIEHIVVSDNPPDETLVEIAMMCAYEGVKHVNLPWRTNDWGNSPASAGLLASSGDYVCFLSDDNAYLPQHFGPLVAMLDGDPSLGFAYSSCLYNATRELRLSPPMGAGIDLGQPLFRRSVLMDEFNGKIPFSGTFSWDWEMIRVLVHERNVKWAHVDELTFVFRLAAYPRILEALA
jgi:glycosyltransferase involved in cell wall biosynthesis